MTGTGTVVTRPMSARASGRLTASSVNWCTPARPSRAMVAREYSRLYLAASPVTGSWFGTMSVRNSGISTSIASMSSGATGRRRSSCWSASMLQWEAPQQACSRIVEPRVARSHDPSPSRIRSGSPCSSPSRRATPMSPSRMSASAVKPMAASSAAMTPCMAALPAREPLGVGAAVLHHPGHRRRGVTESHAGLVDVEAVQPGRQGGDTERLLEALVEPAAVDQLVAPRAEADLHRLGGDLPADHPGEDELPAACCRAAHPPPAPTP